MNPEELFDDDIAPEEESDALEAEDWDEETLGLDWDESEALSVARELGVIRESL